MKIDSKTTHDRIQQECFTFAWNNYPQYRRLLFHPQNELKPVRGETRHEFMLRLSYAKNIGVVAGVLDLIFYYRGVLHCFDIKIGSDKLSDDQKKFILIIIEHGGKCYEINSFLEFKEIFLSIVT